jgi:GTP pyrophosphokinase
MAFKIICRNENICYEDLKKIVLKYPVLDEWYKNYIASPKTNLYQSLHISFINNDNKIVQTQLRTENMDDFTKYGISSYIGKIIIKKTFK